MKNCISHGIMSHKAKNHGQQCLFNRVQAPGGRRVHHELISSLTEIYDSANTHPYLEMIGRLYDINDHALIANKNSPIDVAGYAEYVSSISNKQPAS